MNARRAIALCAALAPSLAFAQAAAWPPPPEVLGRMRDLQAVIVAPTTSKEARAAARLELERLLKSPAGQDRPGAHERNPPPRAAIEPFPSVFKPIEGKLPAPPTARLEVIPDPAPLPRPAINPSTGSVVRPSAPGVAIDPRTGHVLHEMPAGYVDPLTGRFIPK